VGPDLCNLGRRLQKELGEGDPAPEQWLYQHLYDPRARPEKARSVCPSHRFLFKEIPVTGARLADALPLRGEPGTQVVPGPEARALVSYLLNLRKDDSLPSSMKPPVEGATAEPGA
jgi:hypothetical protein